LTNKTKIKLLVAVFPELLLVENFHYMRATLALFSEQKTLKTSNCKIKGKKVPILVTERWALS